MADKKNELNRREFLRKAAITGAVAWAVPVIQSVAATPAYAGTPVCCHSVGGQTGGGCKTACTSTGCTGDACNTPCNSLCPVGQGGCNPCADARACNPACFQNCMFQPGGPGCP